MVFYLYASPQGRSAVWPLVGGAGGSRGRSRGRGTKMPFVFPIRTAARDIFHTAGVKANAFMDDSYTLPQLLRMMSVMLAIGKETRNISDEIAHTLMYIDLLKRKRA